jgi:hypothetical protein
MFIICKLVWPDTARPECPCQESRLVMAVQKATDTGDIQCNGVITYECEQTERMKGQECLAA